MLQILLGSILLLNINTKEPMINKKYLALGDSYTIGESVLKSERYPNQLKTELEKNNITLDAVDIIAKTGWTTDELSSAIDEKNPKNDYDLVTLLIGVNNQYRGRDSANYRKEFSDLLDRAIGFTTSKENVIVISIPDWGVTPFALQKGKDKLNIGQEIDNYNRINFEETLKRKVKYVDVTELSRRAEKDKTLLADDGLHPSGKMYSLWVEDIFPIAKSILEKK